MEVPFYSQRDVDVLEPPAGTPDQSFAWQKRCCAVACLTMLLQHFGRAVSMEEVLRAGLANSGFDPRRGWLHSGQVAVLQSYGLAAYRRNWRLMDGREADYLAGRKPTVETQREVAMVKRQLFDEGVWRVRRLAHEGPVIVSVYRPWGETSSIGHQVVLLDADESSVTFHDPAQRSGAYARYRTDGFFASWKGTAIVASENLTPSTG